MGKHRQKSPERPSDEAKHKENSGTRSRKRESAFSRYATEAKADSSSSCSKEAFESPDSLSESPPPKKGKKNRDSGGLGHERSKSEERKECDSRKNSPSPSRSKRQWATVKKSESRSASGAWQITPRRNKSNRDNGDLTPAEPERHHSKISSSLDTPEENETRQDIRTTKEDSGKEADSSDAPNVSARYRDTERRSGWKYGKSPSGTSRENSPQYGKHRGNESPTGTYKRGAPEIRTFVIDNEKCLVVTKPPELFSIWGQANILCLFGEVEILGSILRQGSPSVDIYSPKTSSSICIVSNSHNGLSKEDYLNDYLDKILADNDEMKTDVKMYASLDENSVVLLFSKPGEKKRLDFVTAVHPYQQIFWSPDMERAYSGYKPLGSLPVAICMDSHSQPIRIKRDMKEFASKLTSEIEKGNNPIVSVCGGQNVGKSTLCRYLVNSALNKCERIAYLECDVGQTEFSPPGCISLHVLNSPVIGPPFTHQRKAIKMIYFGAVTPSDDPGQYLRCLQHAYSAYTSLDSPCPLVVNTMGWNRGLGLVLLASTLQLVKPTYVVQIVSQSKNRNLPEVTPQFINEQESWPDFEMSSQESTASHDLVFINSAVTDQSSNGRYHPSDHRMLSLLGYMSRYQPETGPCLPLHALTPQIVRWSDLAVHVAHAAVPNSQILYALNASIVGLCRVPEEMILSSEDDSLPKFVTAKPICDCLGFGIVRAVDSVNKAFVIISDVKIGPETGVNCLLRGILDLPQILIGSQPTIGGEIPYYGESKDVIGATAIKKRRHLLRRGRVGSKPSA